MLKTLLNPSYIFSFNSADVSGPESKAIFIVFVVVLILGLVSRIVSSKKTSDRHIYELGNRIGIMLCTMGVLGIVLYFFSFENVYLFGARFWYILWIIGLVVWIVYLVRYFRITIPQMRVRDQLHAEQRKYFPPRRKK